MKTSLLLAPVHLALLALFVTLYWRNRSMKRRQDMLVDQLRGQRYWRVNLASPAFFKKWLRLMPFEAKGVLIDEGDHLRITGFWLKGARHFDSRIARSQCGAEWLGNRTLRAGNLHWAQLTTPKGPVLFCADTGMNALPSREALADIFRSAFPATPLDVQQTRDFALEKSARSLAVITLFFGLLLFALLDTFVVSHFELMDAQIMAILTHPATWMGAVAALAACGMGVYRFLLAGQVPARESMVLALMLGWTLLGAALPAAKRIDQLLATAPTQNHTYRIIQVAHLAPKDKALGLPALRFPRARDYWQQFPVGSEYAIPLLRGPQGLWQLDHSVFDKPLVAFYEKQP